MTRPAFVRKSLQFLCLLAASFSTAYAQLPVTLSTAAPNPARVGDLITVTVSGIPAGTIAPSAVSFELTPHDPAFGPTLTVPADSITAVPLSTNRQMRFRVPAEFQNPSPFTARISLRGTVLRGATGPIALASASPQSLNILPAPRLTSVTPAAGVRGQNLKVAIRGEYTQLSPSATTAVAFSGTGLTVNSYTVDAATQIINANISISAGAETGLRNLIVTQIGGRQTTLTDAFFVARSTSGSVSISPATCIAGNSNLALTITGVGTNFLSAPPAVKLGDGVALRALSVVDATRLALTVDCARLAVPGQRNLTVVTDETIVVAPLGFQVLSTNPSLSSLTDAFGVQGQTVGAVRGIAVHSNFLQGATRVSLTGPGRTTLIVGDVSVLSTGEFRADVTIPTTAPAGAYDLTVVTVGETFTAPNAFTVIAASPQILSFFPSSVVAERTATVEVIARFFNFNSTTTADFGPGIIVNTAGVTITPSPSGPVIRFPITASATAALGSRTVRLTTGSTVLTFPLNVLGSPLSLSALNPNSGGTGQTYLRVALTGTGTNFVNGTTTVSLVNPNPSTNPQISTVNSLIITRTAVTSPTALEFDLYIPTRATITSYNLTVQTGGQVLIAPAAFQVQRVDSRITATPASVPQGATQMVTITGQFTNFNASSTLRTLFLFDPDQDGPLIEPKITLGAVQVVSPTEIRVPVTVDVYADPILSPLLQVETTVPSPAGDFRESLMTSFPVVPGPARILEISPNSAAPGASLTVTVRGTGTNFQNNISALSLCAAVLSTTVSGPDTVRASIRVLPTQVPQQCDVSVATLGERVVLVNGFRVTPPSGAAAIASVGPTSGAQGQSLFVDVATSNFNVTAATTADFGEGLTINSVTPLTPAVARVFFAIRPRALLGGRNFTLTTSGQSVSAIGPAFTVTPGIASLSSVLPATARQGQTLTVELTGQSSNFQASLSRANFGGLIVNQLTVTSAIRATALITIPQNANLGFRSVSVTTEGETATAVNAFNVTPAVPQLLSIQPNNLQQGVTRGVQVRSESSSFSRSSRITLGDGITQVGDPIVYSENLVLFNVAVDRTAFTDSGFARTLRVTTGQTILELPNAFQVTPSTATLIAIAPNDAKQGQNVTITVTGQDTNFEQGVTGAAFDRIGTTITSVTVLDPTRARVAFNVSRTAALGLRSLTLSTRGQIARLSNAFQVDPGTPVLISALPVSAAQGQTATIQIKGDFTRWNRAAQTVSFGEGIVTNTVTAVDDETLNAAITISASATVGPRTVTVSGGGLVLSGSAFTVTAGPAALLSSNPASLRQGDTVDVTVLGSATNFLVSTTALNFGPGITVSNLVVNSVTSLSARLTVFDSTSTGPRTVSATTNGEVATLANFQVNPGVAVITQLSPNTARQGAVALPLTVTGRFTNFAAGTTASFGAGIIVNSVTPTSTTQAAVVVTIEPNAALGTRNLTLTSGGNSVTFTDALTVTRSDASLVSASPASVPQGAAQTITVTGLLTNFLTNTTTVAVSGGGITNGLLTIVNPTTLTLALTVSDSAAPGARDITVSTGGEVLTLAGGLTIVPGTPVITVFTPGAIAQQQTVTATFTTRFLALAAPLTVSFPTDPRISAANVQLLNATQFTADIIVQGPATVGLKPLTVTVPGGTATLANAFTVTAGPAAIASFSGASIARNASGTVTVSGIGTSFEAGLTTADFGPGVTTTVTVISPTEATVNAVVAENAAPGVRPMILRTGGETAAPSAGGFTVTAATPFLSSVTPNGFKSNATVIVTVAGQNLSGATFALGGGAAINATSVTTTSTSATFSLDLAGAAIGDYPVVATTVGGSSLTILEPGNTFRVIQASGFAGSNVSVLNIFFDPINNTPAALRSADAPPASVLNIFFDPANNIPASARSAVAAPVSVLNIFFDPVNNTSASARSAVAPPVSVLNIFFDPSTFANNSVASSPNLVVHNTAVAPAAMSLAAKPEQSATAARSGKLPLTLGLDEKVYPGQSLRLQVADADGQAGSVTTVLANRVAIATLAAGEPELLFTVPYGVANLEIQLLIRDADGTVRSSQPISLAITPDSGQQLAGVARHADGQAAAGVDLALYASGLTAEVFFFEQAVAQRPDLTELSPNRLFVASSVHQPNPEAVFGSDPLGLGRAQDVAVRYKGWLFIEEPGTYRFWLDGRAGASFLLDGNPYDTQAELKAGLHPVEIVYWNGVGPESLAWTWQTPGGRREPVSPQVLRTRLPGSYKTSENGEFILPRVPLAVDTLWLQAGAETNPVVIVIPQPRARQIITKPLEITLPAVQ